ncbi:MAG: sigma-54 factor interaction domain-containing protein, partial [Proteobacteria bacterium]|nr:sigma-54 factor interaction domain-containing protein [Pseudomonadota bacterium]
KLGPLLLSPSVIVDILHRYNLYNNAAKAKIAHYIKKVKLVREDYLNLLGIEYNNTQQVAPPTRIEHGRKSKLCSRSKYTLDNILGQSLPLKKAKAMVEQLKCCTSSIVLYGETGTGKELFAQAIHSLSPRCGSCFLTVNCASIPEALAESELFGYEEGAFTGAKKGGKTGLFEHAHGGTIFLDEISDMPMNTQARLLRVLEDGTLLRVGGRNLINV